jgi:hypothetical protein
MQGIGARDGDLTSTPYPVGLLHDPNAFVEKPPHTQDEIEFSRLNVVVSSPQPLQHFKNYPRPVTFQWAAVPGAAKYKLEVDYKQGPEFRAETSFWGLNGADYRIVKGISYPAQMAGMGEYRWRIRALTEEGVASRVSGWFSFFEDE